VLFLGDAAPFPELVFNAPTIAPLAATPIPPTPSISAPTVSSAPPAPLAATPSVASDPGPLPVRSRRSHLRTLALGVALGVVGLIALVMVIPEEPDADSAAGAADAAPAGPGAPTAATSTPADGKIAFTLVNETGLDINNLYVSPLGRDDRGEDLLGDYLLANGAQRPIAFRTDSRSCTWVILAVPALERRPDIEWDVDLCGVSHVTLQYKNGEPGVIAR
jgi:hypothetical protein